VSIFIEPGGKAQGSHIVPQAAPACSSRPFLTRSPTLIDYADTIKQFLFSVSGQLAG